MTTWRHSLKSVVIALAVAYALFAQSFLASFVVTNAVATGDVNIICLCGVTDVPGPDGKLPSRDGKCVLCSLSACSAGAGAALDTVTVALVPPQRADIRTARTILDARELPGPHRTPKLSQAPPQAA